MVQKLLQKVVILRIFLKSDCHAAGSRATLSATHSTYLANIDALNILTFFLRSLATTYRCRFLAVAMLQFVACPALLIQPLLFRVMMGGFPLIIPNDPIMQMKIAEKVSANIRKSLQFNDPNMQMKIAEKVSANIRKSLQSNNLIMQMKKVSANIRKSLQFNNLIIMRKKTTEKFPQIFLVQRPHHAGENSKESFRT